MSNHRRPSYRCAAAALTLGLALFTAAGCAGNGPAEAEPEPARESEEAAPEETTGDQSAEFAYEIEIAGLDDGALDALLRESSQLVAFQNRPPASLGRLRLRAEEDMKRLGAALRSEGYYDAKIGYRIDQARRPLVVALEVAPGERYRIGDYVMTYEGATPPEEGLRPDLAALGIELGAPARAPVVVEAERSWTRLMGERGRPFARVIDRKAVVNRETRTLRVTLRLDAGAQSRFGPLSVAGLSGVDEAYVRGLIPWSEGETYDRRKVDEARRDLSASGLFQSVSIRPAAAAGEAGSLPVSLEVVEAPHRSIGFGANYSTDIGPGGEIFWEHRNYFGRGERLHLSLEGSEIEQVANVEFRKPQYPEPDQALIAEGTATRSDSDAFEELSLVGRLALEFPLAETWRATAGIAPEYSELDDLEGERSFYLIGFPLTAAVDSRDDPLDPTSGHRLDLEATPFIGSGDEDLLFARFAGGGSAYYPIDEAQRYVLAGRARLGVILGQETETLPANKRFYAGGGGSVRGYEFQKVGPLDANNTPLGGRFLTTVSGELRARLFGDFGAVAFLDGGTVTDAAYPDFSEDVLWAAGLGLRYFTAVGPIRADIAFPLNGRDNDNDFEFYVSLGQAF